MKKEMAINAERGLKGMPGSIDCTQWGWKNCPTPWAGEFQDRSGIRSVVAEAVASSDMYFWHVCLRFLGLLNDIQVMERSTITMAYLESPAASIKYTIRDTQFEGAFFLADILYPNYAHLMKIISEPTTARDFR